MLLLQTILPGLSGESAPVDSTKVAKATSELSDLKSLSLDDLIHKLAENLINFAINLAIAIVVFYIGRFVIRKIYKLLGNIFIRRKVDRSLSTFILSLVNIVLYFILVVTVIGILGIETTSFLAIFASAGVALGMALSGTLQNFAGGVLILLLKPYKIGDYIEVDNYAGTVREIQIFSTIITTYDNKSISIPNGGLSTGSVNNWSREAYRRVSWDVSISYGDNVEQARRAILAMFADDSRIEKGILGADEAAETSAEAAGDDVVDENGADSQSAAEQPEKRGIINRLLHRHSKVKKHLSELEEKRRARIAALIPRPDYSPKVLVQEMAESSVNLQIRAWTRTPLYWDVFYDYNEKFYNELPKHGINFPFPQLDVHVTGNA